jgi:O-antigen/teichoic acid export membrane protein
MSKPRRHLGAGAALSVLVQGGPLAAAAVLSIVLARTIGPSGTGHFALLVTLAGLTAMIVSLGLTAGITFEVSRGRWSVRAAFRTSYLASLVMGLTGFVGGLIVFLLLHDSVFQGISTDLAVVALASVPPVIAYQFADAILLGRERYEGYATLELSHAGTLLALGAGLALAFGLSGATVGLPAAAVVGAVVGALLLLPEAKRDAVKDRAESLTRALRFGLQSWGANLLQQINYRFDVLILAAFAGAGDVGVYSVALTLTSVAWVLPQALQTVVFPRVASLDEEAVAGEITSEESDFALAKAVRHGVLLTLPTALIISLLLLIAVPLLYGSKFYDTIWLGFILLPGTLMLGVAKITGSGVTGRGQPRYALYGSGLTAALALALYFGLIPPFGAWGAAVASSLTYVFGALVGFYFFWRVTHIRLREALVPRSDDVADYGGLLRLGRRAWRPGQ